MTTESPYEMSISLSVLNDLGVNLYSNIPSVLAEAVANAWDADAEDVDILIDTSNQRVVIKDNGIGMNLSDINSKYLCVGYKRRENPDDRKTPIHGRPVMGRKGIGKLSLFSIADCIELHTIKDGQKNGLKMSAKAIELHIKEKKPVSYRPIKIMPDDSLKVGTTIVLTDFRRKIVHSESALKKRLARRFSVIGPEHKFNIKVNGTPVGIIDRDYFHKLQYLWVYGDNKAFGNICTKKEKSEKRPGIIVVENISESSTSSRTFSVSGWIGSVKNAGDLKEGEDNLNKIVLMVRGKLAQEDILEDFSEGGIYSKYLMGEINADFLDIDDAEDIATSSRQEIIKDDPRYKALSSFVQKELKHIQSVWTDWRNEEGAKEATKYPPIEKWFNQLSSGNRKRARSLFGKINQLPMDSETARKSLFKYGILAFESLRYKDNLEALDRVSADNIMALTEIFVELDDIEATLYHQIVSERIKVIEALRRTVEENAREKVIQEFLFKELWLLDPSWERAVETPYMEQRVTKEFETINAKLSDEERSGRLDIKYTTTSGRHVIVELKKADRRTKSTELIEQVSKYRNALAKILKDAGKALEPIEVVCVVGKRLKDWDEENGREESTQMLATKNIRVVLYDELINNAYQAYQAFTVKRKEAGRIYELIRSLDEGDLVENSVAVETRG